MNITIHLILLVLAVVCWFLAALNVPVPRVNLTALGLFLFGLSMIVA